MVDDLDELVTLGLTPLKKDVRSDLRGKDGRGIREIWASRSVIDGTPTIRVYQAYNEKIAAAAVAANSFTAPRDLGLWSETRMSWVKPSAAWMAYRCGWTVHKDANQARVLALDVDAAAFLELLAEAAVTQGHCKDKPVVVQWDPERELDLTTKLPPDAPFLRALPEVRSLQVGLRAKSGASWLCDARVVRRITDVTPSFRSAHDALGNGDLEAARQALWPEPSLLERRVDVPSALCATLEMGSGDLRLTAAVNDDADGGWDAAPVAGLPWLYIGSLSAAESRAGLAAANVQVVLTVAARLRAEPPLGIAHHVVPVDDHPAANLLAVLPSAFAIIDDAAARAASCSGPPPALLVHCASGVSRSVGVVVGWLVERQRQSLPDALALARTARKLGNPNVGFKVQLALLERDGSLDAALTNWTPQASKEALGRARERRCLANETHTAIDSAEVALQRARSDAANGETAGALAALDTVRRELITLGARLDAARVGDGLPEDSVAQTVFKAASAKHERLMGQT